MKKQTHYFTNKGPSSQSYGFSSSHVWMWELEYKESWTLKNWCFWTVVLEKTLESPLNCKESKPVNPKGNQSWIFIGRTDVEAETPILWPPDVKNWLIRKDPDAWERLKVGGEGDNRGWDGWMPSPTRWMWVWASSGSWWRTGRPGVLQSMGPQRVEHDCVAALTWPLTVVEMESVIHLWNFLPYIKGQSYLLVLSRRYRCSNKDAGCCLWLSALRNEVPKSTGVQQRSSGVLPSSFWWLPLTYLTDT